MRRQGVDPAGGVQKQGLLIAAAARRLAETVTGLVAEGGGVHFMPLGGAHPALFRQHHGDRFAGHQGGLVQCRCRGPLHDGGTACVAEGLRIGDQLFADQVTQAGA